MREVAAHVNDRQRQVEQLQKVYQVQTSIVECPSLLEPHRRFVKEGRVSTLGEDRVRSRTLFLFNDAVVFAKDLPRWESVVETIEASSAGVRQKHHYFYDGHIKLQHAVVEDTPQLPLGFALRSSARGMLRLRCSIPMVCPNKKRCSGPPTLDPSGGIGGGKSELDERNHQCHCL